MRQGLTAIIGCKVKLGNIADNNASLFDKLKAIYTHFDQKVGGIISSIPTAMGVLVSTVADVRITFLRLIP